MGWWVSSLMAWACQSRGDRPHRGAGLTGGTPDRCRSRGSSRRWSLRLLGKPSRPWVSWPSRARAFRERANDHTETLIAIAGGTSLASPGGSVSSSVYRSSCAPGSCRGRGQARLWVHIRPRWSTQPLRWWVREQLGNANDHHTAGGRPVRGVSRYGNCARNGLNGRGGHQGVQVTDGDAIPVVGRREPTAAQDSSPG
jgi:hypothetical protein